MRLHAEDKRPDCVPFWLEPVSVFGSLGMTVPVAVHLCWAFHRACPSDHIDARSRGNRLAEISSSPRRKDVVSMASDPTVTSRASTDRLLRTEPQVRLTILFSYRTITGTSSLFRTHALLLPGGRFLRPRNSRGEYGKQPHDMNHARPQARQSRGHEQTERRPQSRPIRVHEQSASVSSSRQQARQQPVRSRDQNMVSTGYGQTSAAGANSTQNSHSSALSTSEASTRSDFGREFEQTADCPRFRIVVAIAPLTNFPVHIRTIPPNVHI